MWIYSKKYTRPLISVMQYHGSGRGTGAGKGGGYGGSIIESGGKLGERGAAKEDEYFHKLQKSQLKKLKDQQEIKDEEERRFQEAVEENEKKKKKGEH
ncbi:ATPase inhibitor mai-1, mitochondrial-like [Periplaneta americana]|uniref:ATPase inhibitor mai-1, mitochondrial-like n=1 Tax=Periplaneta americana TaxID=6978 RepID=UPI0037E79212